MGFLDSIGEALGGKLLDFGFDTATGYINNYYNKKAAKTSFERAMMMSNTAHQREVADLRAAGLNPVLSAIGNGASTVVIPPYAGQQGQTSSIAPHIQASSAKKVAESQSALLDSQKKKTDAEADMAEAEADYIRKKTDEGVQPFDKKYQNVVEHAVDSFLRKGENIGEKGRQFFSALKDILFNSRGAMDRAISSAAGLTEHDEELKLSPLYDESAYEINEHKMLDKYAYVDLETGRKYWMVGDKRIYDRQKAKHYLYYFYTQEQEKKKGKK